MQAKLCQRKEKVSLRRKTRDASTGCHSGERQSHVEINFYFCQEQIDSLKSLVKVRTPWWFVSFLWTSSRRLWRRGKADHYQESWKSYNLAKWMLKKLWSPFYLEVIRPCWNAVRWPFFCVCLKSAQPDAQHILNYFQIIINRAINLCSDMTWWFDLQT